MKKVLLAVMALTAFAGNAQDGFKGKWFVMGQAGYGTTNDGKTTSYSILPAVGTFVSPTTAVGLAIGYVGGNDNPKEIETDNEGMEIGQGIARFFCAKCPIPIDANIVPLLRFSRTFLNFFIPFEFTLF